MCVRPSAIAEFLRQPRIAMLSDSVAPDVKIRPQEASHWIDVAILLRAPQRVLWPSTRNWCVRLPALPNSSEHVLQWRHATTLGVNSRGCGTVEVDRSLSHVPPVEFTCHTHLVLYANTRHTGVNIVRFGF